MAVNEARITNTLNGADLEGLNLDPPVFVPEVAGQEAATANYPDCAE